MELSTPLRFAVHADGYDGPSDVVNALSLGEFVAGRQPYAETVQLQRVQPDAGLVPPEVDRRWDVVNSGRRVHVATGAGWTLLVSVANDRTAALTVTAATAELAQQILAAVTDGAVEPPPPVEKATTIGFWQIGSRNIHMVERTITAVTWPSIRRNYAAAVADALDRLMALDGDRVTGRLLLLHGPPGTGKTTALRALAHAWSNWCQVEYVVDPEHLLAGSGPLMTVLLGTGRVNAPDGNGSDEGRPRWRMLVLEDCDELIRADAKRATGQALGRLLNLTDGLLGHGLRVLVCITTNERLDRLHPAVIRPGRCLAQIHVGSLPAAEAAAWLGNGHHVPADGASLAELFAMRGDFDPVEQAEEPNLGVGQYL